MSAAGRAGVKWEGGGRGGQGEGGGWLAAGGGSVGRGVVCGAGAAAAGGGAGRECTDNITVITRVSVRVTVSIRVRVEASVGASRNGGVSNGTSSCSSTISSRAGTSTRLCGRGGTSSSASPSVGVWSVRRAGVAAGPLCALSAGELLLRGPPARSLDPAQEGLPGGREWEWWG